MTRFVDIPFDWVAALAFASGAVVIIASMAALAATVLAVAMAVI